MSVVLLLCAISLVVLLAILYQSYTYICGTCCCGTVPVTCASLPGTLTIAIAGESGTAILTAGTCTGGTFPGGTTCWAGSFLLGCFVVLNIQVYCDPATGLLHASVTFSAVWNYTQMVHSAGNVATAAGLVPGGGVAGGCPATYDITLTW